MKFLDHLCASWMKNIVDSFSIRLIVSFFHGKITHHNLGIFSRNLDRLICSIGWRALSEENWMNEFCNLVLLKNLINRWTVWMCVICDLSDMSTDCGMSYRRVTKISSGMHKQRIRTRQKINTLRFRNDCANFFSDLKPAFFAEICSS